MLPRTPYQVSEGANTMDIGRTLMPNYLPRHRLDAGTFGTMGVGLGFAIAAAVAFPDKQVVAVEGDSAFGFSGMELEAAVRHRLSNLTVLVVNNNGIYQGLEELDDEPEWCVTMHVADAVASATLTIPRPFALTRYPPTALLPEARYEKVCEALGGRGYCVSQPKELLPALKSAMADKVGPMPAHRCFR